MPKPTNQFLSRFSIRQQILIGYLPVLLLLVVIAFISYRNFEIFSGNMDKLGDVTEENLAFKDIEKDMLLLQRNVLVYSYVGYKGIVKKIERLQDTLEQKLEAVRPYTSSNADISDRFERLIEHYEDYKDAFEEAVRKRGELADIKKNKLTPLAEQGKEKLAALSSTFVTLEQYRLAYLTSKLEQSMADIATNVRIFEASPDASLINKTLEIMNQMEADEQALIAAVKDPLTTEQIQQFDGIRKEYEQAFNQVINLNRVYMQLVNVVLAGKAAEIDTLSQELDELVAKQSDRLNQKIENSITKSREDYLSLSILAATIGIISALAVAMGIARPVKAMTKTLLRLAGGEADIEIPAMKRRDEVGDMAKAANEFKNMSEQITQQAEAIQENQAMLSAIVDNMNDGLITIDDHGIIQSYNNACEKILGHSQKEALGKNISMMMPQPYKAQHDDYLMFYRQTGKKNIIGKGREVTGLRKDGSEFPIDLSVSEINLPGRKLFSGIIRDITDRKQAEEALLQANAELEEFAYRTSHDLRSPLVSSIGLLKVAEQCIESGKTSKATQSIQMASKSIAKLEVLVKDILALTQAKNEEEEASELDLYEMVQEAISKFTHMDHFDRLNIVPSVKCERPVFAKKGRVMAIIENLISNAIKYQDTEKPDSFIHISAKTESRWLLLTVEDNGLGIPKEKQGDMFGMFKRFHPKTSFGSGLGLYMLKKSAEVLKGTIEYEDTGSGSRFTLKIPA
ncbi:MAG: PAS domain S-box protein [Rickettsiales bacterium]|nr:PAS domain S-box protein [Rickettsiales bacterium]